MRRFFHNQRRKVLTRFARAEQSPMVHALKIGSMIGPDHKVTGYLGSGGFGYTYLAKVKGDRNVALKECFPFEYCRRNENVVSLRTTSDKDAFEEIKKKFRREAEILRSTEHPNIVSGGRLIEANDTFYIEMELAEGEVLSSFISKWFCGLSLRELSSITDQVLDALDHLHSREILHKDISPDNILVSDKGKVTLIDLGSAARIGPEFERDDLLVVKAGYSPQEFYRPMSSHGKGSDLYQLGATLLHCLTGEKPAESVVRLMARAQRKEDPIGPMPNSLRSRAALNLKPLENALAIMMEDRLQTVDDWKNEMKSDFVEKAS